MNALKADPRTLDLRALAPHFYNLSERILELFEEEEMVDVLGDVGGSDPRGWLKHLIGRAGTNKLSGIQETSGRYR